MKILYTYFIYFLLFVSGLLGCTSSEDKLDVQSVIAGLKDHQAKVIVTIDGTKFYEDNRIFSGSVMVAATSLRLNLYDNLHSNVIASVMSNDWYKASNRVHQVTAGDNTHVNILIGKIVDSTQNKGIGYLFMDGQCEIVNYSKELLVMKFSGLTAEYMKMSSQDKWQKINGYIVVKKPDYQFLDIDEKSFNYSN